MLCTALCVWNAKTSVGGNGTATVETHNRKPELRTTTVEIQNRKPELKTTTVDSHNRKPDLKTTTMESHNSKPELGTATNETHNPMPEVNHPQGIVPGTSWRSFKFNMPAIKQSMESGFSA